jgi:DNA adenine methylase
VTNLPVIVKHVGVPPIKCQGIKTKLVPFILRSIRWCDGGNGRWIEPFLGFGVVAFNLAPRAAVLADTNEHIIRLYRAIQVGEISSREIWAHLGAEGQKLEAGGADYYYEVRDRFNQDGRALDFLFLNRACFNGVMRFNRKGAFNVPFGHKPQRFSKAYITKIADQVDWVARQMAGKDWEFRIENWRDTLSKASADDFVYLDPPYIGRHTDYYNSWTEEEARLLADTTQRLPGGFALSMWLENRHRKNPHIEDHWGGLEIRTSSHFYHVGSTESLRNAMEEALVVKLGFIADGEIVEAGASQDEQQVPLPI